MTDSQKVERSGGGFTTPPPPTATTPRRLSLTSRLALRSIRCLQGSGPGAPSMLRPRDFVGLGRPRETERSLAPDRRQKLLPSAVIAPDARKSLSEMEFCDATRQTVSAFDSCVNSAPQRKIVSPQWDSRTRPAKRQHRRCIGCGKRPCFPSLTYWFAFVACASFVTTCFRTSQTKAFSRFELQTNAG
jgi:hypothetical protein